jgi:YVTN family beta-propeller protein
VYRKKTLLRPKNRQLVRALSFFITAIVALLCSSQPALATKASPYIYVADTAFSGVFPQDALAVIDTATFSVVANIPLGVINAPLAGAVSPDGSTIYVISSQNNVSVINAVTNTVTKTINVGPNSAGSLPLGMAITPNGSDLYVTNATGAVVDIATATNTVTKTISLGLGSGQTGAGVAISPDGAKVYVAVPSLKSVTVIDTATKLISAMIPVGTNPSGVTMTPDGAKLYVINQGTVSVIATNTGIVSKTIPLSTPFPTGAGFSIAITPDGSRVYAQGGTAVSPNVVNFSEIATSIDTVIAGIPAAVGAIAITPDGSRGLVTDGNRVLVIDTATGTALKAIPNINVSSFNPLIFTGPFRSASTLQAMIAGTGTGIVTSNVSGINCGSACSTSYGTGSVVTLTATASGGSVFMGWSGACTGVSDCIVKLNDDAAVTATFVAGSSPTNALSVSLLGTGSGIVTTAPSGARCGTVCLASYPSGSSIVLTAAPDAGSTFTGWSGGGCSGTAACTVPLSADTAVTASFARIVTPNTLSVAIAQLGAVVSIPAGINCSFFPFGACAAAFQPGTSVTLAANSVALGTVFTGWSGGGCSGTAPCTVTMNADTVVNANFGTAGAIALLSVATDGSGSGTITSNPSGYFCRTACNDTVSFALGSTVTLTANPDAGSTFAGWSGGGCTGTTPCTITLNDRANVTATFTFSAPNATLSVSSAGQTSGRVTSMPAGVDCGTSCSISLPARSTVLLTATPDSGSQFIGWSGACFGAGPCIVSLTGNMSVTANFAPAPFNDTLTVALAGAGSGTVTSQNPSTINCGAICTAVVSDGSFVTLNAVAAPGSILTGWSNTGCGTSTTCQVTPRADTLVTATFQPASTLTVINTGPAIGTVFSSNVTGIYCPSTCSAPFATGSQVTLTAPPFPGPTFLGWSGGGCSGTGACTVTLNGDVTIGANFAVITNTVSVVLSGTGSGTVTSSPSGISCGTSCSARFNNSFPVALTASANAGSMFLGWSRGDCSSNSTCVVVPGSDVSVTATFAPAGTVIPPPPSNVFLTVSEGGGPGLVTSNPTGISCAICSAPFAAGTMVMLSASPAQGYFFTGWSGACTGLTCRLTLNADTSVVANFAIAGILTVAKSGPGTGVVTTSPSGITCGPTCTATFVQGDPVTITAAAAQGSIFTGWSGVPCSGTLPCATSVYGSMTVTANFTLAPTTAMLSVSKVGTGSGIVTSSPSGIACGPTCTASFTIGSPTTLTATADAGSTFVGWSGGSCSGNKGCAVTLGADTAVTANFVANSATNIALVSAILPSSRSVQVGATATLFGTMINAGPGTATYCSVAPATSMPGSFYFQTTDPATNGLTGTANTPVDIPQGAAQSFLLAFSPSAAFNPTDVAFAFSCANANAAASFEGVNTLMLSASTAPIPDIVSIAGTLTNDGQLHLAGAADTGAFVVAIANVGAAGQITATADTGGANLPVSISICQTNQTTGACLQPPATTVPAAVGSNTTASFGIFVKATGAIPFMPAVNRAFVRFLDATGTVRGSTSVAVRTQ